ncbi:MAG TPA: hypothetical protein VEF03_03645, partial [Candidatus Binataceae bacterium]|nr:hypothetical protein [Candidatus Binataceae bacterium]
MPEIEISTLTPTASSPVPAPAGSRYPRLLSLSRHILGLGFWTYAILKLFVLDVDVYLAHRFLPEYYWLLRYKLLLFAGAGSLTWLCVPSNVFWPLVLHTAFYPIILATYYLPNWILRRRSWVFTIACLNSVLSFFTSVKYNFIGLTVFVISFLVVIKSQERIFLIPALLAIAGILTVLYVYRFAIIFRPSKVFRLYTRVFNFFGEKSEALFVPADKTLIETPVENLNANQLQLRTTSLQMAMIFNRLCIFAGKKLRDYQESRLDVISYIVG